MIRRLELALALIPELAVAAPAQVAAPAGEEVGAYARVLDYAYPADEPGAVALVARDGEVLYRGAAGLADLEPREARVAGVRAGAPGRPRQSRGSDMARARSGSGTRPLLCPYRLGS